MVSQHVHYQPRPVDYRQDKVFTRWKICCRHRITQLLTDWENITIKVNVFSLSFSYLINNVKAVNCLDHVSYCHKEQNNSIQNLQPYILFVWPLVEKKACFVLMFSDVKHSFNTIRQNESRSLITSKKIWQLSVNCKVTILFFNVVLRPPLYLQLDQASSL